MKFVAVTLREINRIIPVSFAMGLCLVSEAYAVLPPSSTASAGGYTAQAVVIGAIAAYGAWAVFRKKK